MKRKLNEEAGLTVMEMLAATVVLVLLVMMLGTGLQMTVNGYQKITAQSEVDLLLSTAMDALADDLRFARDVEGTDGEANKFTYRSDSFEGRIKLELGGSDSEHADQIIVTRIYSGHIDEDEKDAPRQLLSGGAYGIADSDGDKAYVVTKMDITPHKDEGIFTIDLEVATADRKIKAGGTVTVRCLNGLKGLK